MSNNIDSVVIDIIHLLRRILQIPKIEMIVENVEYLTEP